MLTRWVARRWRQPTRAGRLSLAWLALICLLLAIAGARTWRSVAARRGASLAGAALNAHPAGAGAALLYARSERVSGDRHLVVAVVRTRDDRALRLAFDVRAARVAGAWRVQEVTLAEAARLAGAP